MLKKMPNSSKQIAEILNFNSFARNLIGTYSYKVNKIGGRILLHIDLLKFRNSKQTLESFLETFSRSFFTKTIGRLPRTIKFSLNCSQFSKEKKRLLSACHEHKFLNSTLVCTLFFTGLSVLLLYLFKIQWQFCTTQKEEVKFFATFINVLQFCYLHIDKIKGFRI